MSIKKYLLICTNLPFGNLSYDLSPIVKDCIQCFRITPCLPFQTVGLDYAGPFWIKGRKGRGYKVTKG